MLLALLVVSGCAPSKLLVRPVRYEADVRVEPEDHVLEVHVSVELERLDGKRPVKRRARLDLLLHPGLELRSFEAEA